MKTLILALVCISGIAAAQWVPVAVNTNTGDMRPLAGAGTNNWAQWGGYFSTNVAFNYSAVATQCFEAAQARSIELLGSLVVSNITTNVMNPDCTGFYKAMGQFSYGAPVYARTAGTWYVSRMTNGFNYYKITDRIGDIGTTYWGSGAAITGVFYAVEATGDVQCVSLHTNIWLDSTLALSTFLASVVTNARAVSGITNNATLTNSEVVVTFNTNTAAGGVTYTFVNTNTAAGTVTTNGTQIAVGTNAVGGAADWSLYPAVSDVSVNNYRIDNVGALSTTGALVIGFGVFTTSNSIPAPASSNVWFVYAYCQVGTNYLMGVDSKTNRTWIGNKP